MSKDQAVLNLPEGFIPEIAPWIWGMQDIRRRTKKAVEGLSMEQLQAHPGLIPNSIGSLLYHIAGVELGWLYTEVLTQDFPPEASRWFNTERDRDEQGRLLQITGETLERHLARLDYARGLLLETFKGMAPEEFRRPRSFPEYDVTPEWVLYHLLEHEAGHFAQIKTVKGMLGLRSSPM